MSRPATPDDVDAVCAKLPGAERGVCWGDRPSWLATGSTKPRPFVIHRPPHPSATDPLSGEPFPDLLVVRTPGPDTKAALVQGGGPWFDVEHFRRSTSVLVQQCRLGEVGLDELTEVLTDAWATVAPRRLVAAHREH